MDLPSYRLIILCKKVSPVKHLAKLIMKKLIAFIFSLLILFSVYSQTVNDIPIKDIDVEYIQIVGTSKLLSTKVTINIDFGQHDKIWVAKDTQVKDGNGKLVVFNSMIDALNFFSKNGYGFVQAYAVTAGNQNVYHYLMRKEKE